MDEKEIISHDLSDEMLDAVNGGMSTNGSAFHVGERIKYTGLGGCSHCKEKNAYGVIQALKLNRYGTAIDSVILRMDCCKNNITTSYFTLTKLEL